MKLDLVICGVGGQGVIKLAKIITAAAVSERYDAHYVAYSGIAQLNGSVVAHVRVGSPAGPSPKIRRGRADYLIALDPLEALRNAAYVNPDGVAIVDTRGVAPSSAVIGREKSPSIRELETAFSHTGYVSIYATGMACKVGSPIYTGAVMLGAMSAMATAIDRDSLVMGLREALPEAADEAVEAFFMGHSFVTGEEE